MRKLLKTTAATAALILLLNVPALADVRRDETVYTLLNADGSVSTAAVVVRLSGSSSEAVTEYGDVSGWKLLDGAGEPEVGADRLIWPAASITSSGLYYQIPTDEQAPVAVSIVYQLDGRTVSAGELAGQSGRLTIELTLTNLWKEEDGYTPLLCQATFTLPSDRFANVEGGGTHIMVGHNLTAVATLLPAPTASVTLSADVTQLELEPIDIQVMPGSVVLPAELEENIDKLSDGVAKLDDGAGELRDGVARIRETIGELADGARQAGRRHRPLCRRDPDSLRRRRPAGKRA
jgi:X-X-X-Leu-X-X-Gly heptad repeat protein